MWHPNIFGYSFVSILWYSLITNSYSLYIFNIRRKYSWMLWNIFVNRNNIHQINIFANRNNIHEMKLWQTGIGIYLWPNYQQIDLWQIYLQTIRKLFANRELFAKHWIMCLLCADLSFCNKEWLYFSVRFFIINSSSNNWFYVIHCIILSFIQNLLQCEVGGWKTSGIK